MRWRREFSGIHAHVGARPSVGLALGGAMIAAADWYGMLFMFGLWLWMFGDEAVDYIRRRPR